MPQNTHLELIGSDSQRLPALTRDREDLELLRAKARELATRLQGSPQPTSSHILAERCDAVRSEIKPLLAALDSSRAEATDCDDLRWLFENARLLHAELQTSVGDIKKLREEVPHVQTTEGEIVVRILVVAEVFLELTAYQFSEQKLTYFVEAFQESTVLDLRELWALADVLKLRLLERIAELASHFVHTGRTEAPGVGHCVRSLREIGQTTWKDVLEPLILLDGVLRDDPAGCYAQMDFESRDLYRNTLSNIAKYSDFSEMEVAWAALQLAQEAAQEPAAEPRIALRRSHIGYYLVGDGATLLKERVGFKCPLAQSIKGKLRRAANAWYLPAVAILTCAITGAVTFLLASPGSSWSLFLLSIFAVLLPSSQAAVQLINLLTISLLTPEILPKLDFSEGIPADCLTMVAIPSLLFSEEQVRGLVADLEVRFLGNHDPHMHFALLTDLPDSHEPTEEDSPLIDLCADLINQLNEKYKSQRIGSFFLFHRHRTYNPREKAWMGWERKRGKLLELNRLLRGECDRFPVKVGDLRVLPQVRFVITLDCDTELPRRSAQRMVGTLAHPLNSAIIAPEKNIVVAGYGILQPRVGVSVQSTARSRLAAIYAGETGLDIYTRAVSDTYQDLFGEGSYTGKGIYEVDIVHRIFDGRFPRNALLSHDLIEGAYARAGLVSDIEVIEDYPSHYSAYNRRKHRWLRGDWQIAGWMFPRVPNESGAKVKNPISIISRWKIFDNLRRSLVEPATFLLLVLGWLVLGVPGWWTVVTVCILFIPTWSEFVLKLFRATWKQNTIAVYEALTSLYTAHVNVFFTLTFLAHQTLVSLDAVIRALVRRLVTHCRLLEWETAAEIELGPRRSTPIDRYLEWMPALALGLGLVIFLVRPGALPAALPLLLLWGSSKAVSTWLNRSSVTPLERVSRSDRAFLRSAAFHTWRYFAQFSTDEHNWLIPDNVQEQPPAIASRISPTNLGFLLNARQAACEFGYLTLPEFAEQTLQTLATVSGLQKYRGHLFNWYNTRTLQPLAPKFVSSVDSGNLVASLWTLQQGSREQLREPLLRPSLFEGFVDCVRALEGLGILSESLLPSPDLNGATDTWLHDLLALSETCVQAICKIGNASTDVGNAQQLVKEAECRIQAIKQMVHCYAPWSLPEFAALRRVRALNLEDMDNIPLECLTPAIEALAQRLTQAADRCISPGHQLLCGRLQLLLPDVQRNVARLVKDIRIISTEAGKLADEMDFAFLLNRRNKLMSVGFNVGAQQLHSGCYDLLGTESRTAVFVAIAKGDIPQEAWFRLGRAHTLDKGRPVILSWTGTLFEYLMPTLWMRSYPRTLLERSRLAAVRSQQAYAASKGVPWGISESAHAQLDEGGNYQYYAFGLPHLAQRKTALKALVISPYSTFLALLTDPSAAIRNLRRMAQMNWFGSYGFYESADYGSPRHRFWQHPYQLVRCWMAHHQGMSLLALTNFLNGNIVQRWFHSDRRVQATELLLQEKPVAHVRRKDLHRGTTAA